MQGMHPGNMLQPQIVLLKEGTDTVRRTRSLLPPKTARPPPSLLGKGLDAMRG